MVLRLYPDEQAFQLLGMISEIEIQTDMMMPSIRFGNALGLRATRGPNMSRLDMPQPIDKMYSLHPDLPESKDERFRHRLCMVLNTFSISKREARFKADLVACWASMCNIKYPYDAYDSYVAALQKVLHSLRTEHKVKVYNFLVNTAGASGEVDANFQEYASTHEQCNARIVKGKFSGIPIFSGRADTGIHLRLAIARPTKRPHLKESGVKLRRIKDAFILFVVSLKDYNQFLYHLAQVVSGTADQFMFANVLNNVSEILKSTPSDQLNRYSLAVVRIPLDSPDVNDIGKLAGMVTWAIVPSDLGDKMCLVAREGLNGTLVLASAGEHGLEIVAYITLTDHRSGTLLINVDAHDLSCKCGADHGRGHIEITLKSAIRGVSQIALFLMTVLFEAAFLSNWDIVLHIDVYLGK
jgi:hypothetical protein